MIDERMKEKLCHAVQDGAYIEKCLLEENSWQVLYQLSDIRENLLEWYDFREQASLLEIGAECGALTGLFCRKVRRVVAVEESERDCAVNLERNRQQDNLTVLTGNIYDLEIKEKFDYVTLIGGLACAGQYGKGEDPYVDLLKKAKEFLKPEGKLLLAIENKYGMKYFAGATEDHTGRCFDGLENYVAADNVRTFSHKTLDKMLREAGFSCNQFYYPMPDYKLPAEIYSDQCLPSFGSIRYPSVAYDRDRYELIDERLAFDSVCQDEMFGEFANSFLVISSAEQPAAPERTTVYAKYNRQRALEYQISTKIIVNKDGSRQVEKEALRPEAKRHVEKLIENRKKLTDGSGWPRAGKDIPMPVEIFSIGEGRVRFPFVAGTSLAKEVNACLGRKEAFLSALHRAVDSIYGTYSEISQNLAEFKATEEFESVFGISREEQDTGSLKNMKALRVSNIDSILSNFIRMPDGRLICLDYEWVFDFPIPAEYLIYRTVYYYYSENIHYIKIGASELWETFGLSEEKVALFRRMDDNFQQYVHGKGRKYIYTSNYGKKSINIGKDIQIGESWFLSIADDIHYLNSHLGGRRDLIRCHVKVHRKNELVDKCERKAKNILRKLKHRLVRTGRKV